MTGQRIGYIRVSTFDQNPERQLEGVKVDRAFSDKASGKDVKRPQLEALISFARTGDTVVGTVAKLAMRQPFVLFKGLTFQKLCLP
ncbi:recombinase family protein, partial [Escherichia coli]|uniref:recombinase family protein n=1 Tax=Escherichia coli TaxID=562 RepID=UPI001FF49D93